ncbi:sialic acid-binding Ig-like lectin 10 isoform X2 [Dicentrarchus labrax]|uniref:sialic acid-binding Ig-like lectin 10 isoform X2 n=1 Tax=Dicentrarchus labrax TaxID=13489 RepID=UPI0021F518CB|nr:sialic acid-binding Ig-like lectin 10 isoform X2 [Dicentrarchus labrax]
MSHSAEITVKRKEQNKAKRECVEKETDGLNYQTKMFVLVWATLLFAVTGSNADKGAPVEGKTHCLYEFCITLNEAEISTEAGLCAVIPCSFTPGPGFSPKNIVWYKCEPSKQKCVESDIIFHTKKNKNVQSGFKGRVSLLDPDVSLNNCSFIINDITESDSGSYQLRVNGNSSTKTDDGFTFPPRATVSVKDLTQKPTVMSPPLTEGQQTTLTCTAPGLCSGSLPKITWMWRGTGENDSHITANITEFKTEKLTAVTQRHSSTLTFNLSAEHHSTKVTCKVSFTNNITTEETVTLNVTYVKEVKITGNTSAKEGETLNLTCSVESFPPALITWTKLSDKNMQNGTKTCLQEESGMGTFTIHKVTTKDSGQYICTAKHLNNTLKETVDVAVIYMKKPVITGNTNVEEGHALNLTCSVESFPLSNITWSNLGSNKNLHSEPNTDRQNNIGSAPLVIHKVTTKDSGQYICTAQHLNNTLKETVDVTVIYMKKPVITGNTTVEWGQTLNLTCSVESFPLSNITWSIGGSNTNLHSEPTTDLQNNIGSATLVIHNVTADHSGQYICTTEHLNNMLNETVDVAVIYMKKPIITGNTTVEWGQTLNLTCSVESFPPSRITWSNLGSNTNLLSEPNTDLQNNTESATLVIRNVTADHSGQYICTAQHLNNTLNETVDVTVTLFPKILKHSGCKVQSEVLTCMCISEGLPLPTIRWPLLKNHTEYSFITTVSSYTVNSTVSLSVKDHSNTVVECVSSNEIGEAKENLTVQTDASEQEDQSTGVLKMVSRLEVVIAFFIGVLLSAVICCLVKKCHRKKMNLDETLEMVTNQEDLLIDVGQAVEDDQTYYQEAAEDGEGVGEPKDVQYATIDFSVLKRRSPREAANAQETTETEYAEIKKAVKEERKEEERGGEEEENEVLDGKEEDVMIGEDEETKQHAPEEDEGEDTAVYSSVKDIMGEI